MEYGAIHGNPGQQRIDCLIVGIFEHGQLSETAKELDIHSLEYISKLLANGDMTGRLGQTLMLYQIPHIAADRILLIGLGKPEELNESAFRKALTQAAKTVYDMPIASACCYLTELNIADRDIAWKTRQTIEIFAAVRYRFDRFKTKNPKPVFALNQLLIGTAKYTEAAEVERGIREGMAIASGMQYVKDLANMPSNICTPSYLAQQAQALADQHTALSINVLEIDDMAKLGMGALLSVAKGSHEPAKLIILHYHGAQTGEKPIALVGKGVTFDTGGISLKPSAGMDEMKYDMTGAASVLGTIKAAVELQLPINIVGIMPTTENMPGGSASKPGDIVVTMSGQTIEILNTDAEGRLILSDALTYSTRFNPAVIIDIATLTGAMIITLGNIATGLMSNNEALTADMMAAGQASFDRVWPLPLWDDFQELINTPVADMANLAESAKSIGAACLLKRFVGDYPWAHLDIAGSAWKSGKEKGSTGRPIPLLVQYLLHYAQGKINDYSGG